MLQFIILGYLVYEIIRLSQLPDVSAIKFSPPTEPKTSSVPTTPSQSLPSTSPKDSLMSEVSTSGPPSTSTAIPN